MERPSQCVRVYLVPSTSIHQIRQSLQIILDYAEINGNPKLAQQVHIINDALDSDSCSVAPASEA